MSSSGSFVNLYEKHQYEIWNNKSLYLAVVFFKCLFWREYLLHHKTLKHKDSFGKEKFKK